MNCTQSNYTLGDYIGEILKSEMCTGGRTLLEMELTFCGGTTHMHILIQAIFVSLFTL
jgi:hypothetical protein